ncbi:MAG: hypothetical protein E7404_02770 [Ruminococcaceae bacterium]|nr:hypothetical protein [Oscillospiraceae bacterium]
MYINKLNIISFGAFCDKEITFENGLNVLYGENESGKSTILAFIKFIFYGIANRKNDFKKYIPLSGEPMNGSITVTDGDVQYEISRNSKLTKAKQVQVFNKTTGERMSPEFEQNIGQNLFLMSETTFLNTLFLYDAHVKVSGDDGEITTKLSNMTLSGDENVSQKDILKKIEDDIANYTSARRKNAFIPNLEEKISDLNNKLFFARENSEKLLLIENRKDEIKKQITIKQDEYNSLLNKKILAKKNEHRIKLLDCEQRLERAQNNLLNCQNQILALDGEKFENIKNVTIDEEKDFLAGEDFSKFDTKLIVIEEREKNLFSKKKMSVALLMAFALATAVLLFVSPYLSLIGISGVIFSFLFFYFVNKKIALTKTEKDDIIRQKEENSSLISKFLSEVKLSGKEEYISLKNEYTQYLANISALNSKVDVINSEVCTCKKELEKVTKEIVDEFKEEKKSGDEIIEDIKNSISNLPLYEIEKNLLNASKELSELKMAFSNLELELKMKKDAASDIVKISDELENARILLKERKEELEVLNEAKNIFDLALNEQRNNFAPLLTKKVGKIFSSLTGGKYEDLLLDEDFFAHIKKDAGYTNQEILSEGTLDQLYFSVRFGIIELVGEKNLPVFLDDAFIRYDEKRLLKVLSFLDDYSHKNQVIISTCQVREKEVLNKKANIINI